MHRFTGHLDVHGFPGFSGNGCACTNSGYQTAFSPPMWPGNEARHRYVSEVSPPSLYLCESSIAPYSDVHTERPCVIVSLASTASCQNINMRGVTSLCPTP